MKSTDGTTHFELDHEDMELIISGLADVSNEKAFPVDAARACDLRGTLQTITRLWSEWRITASDPIGGE